MYKLAVVTVSAVLLIASGVFAQQKSGKDGVYEELNFFDEAFERVRQDAVDPVTDTKLIGAAIAGMLSGLDPHSSFLDEEAFKALQKAANDNETGLGLVVTIENGQLKVISPQDGSPAAQAGIKPGDLIFSIDKEPSYDLTLGEAEQKLRGPAGSEIVLSLRRANESPFDVKIKRVPFKLQTVTAHVEAGV
jgi:carboxyl-terminal processing protease